MKYTAYLFDFDYTLADSSAGIVLCFRIILERLHYTDITDDAIRRTIGMTLEEAFALLTGGAKCRHPVSMETGIHTGGRPIHEHQHTSFSPTPCQPWNSLKQTGAKIGIVSTKYRRRITDFFQKTRQLPTSSISSSGRRRLPCKASSRGDSHSYPATGNRTVLPALCRRQHHRCTRSPSCRSRFCGRAHRHNFLRRIESLSARTHHALLKRIVVIVGQGTALFKQRTDNSETVLNFYKSSSRLDISVFVCALGDFWVLFVPVLRQTARYLPHHRSKTVSHNRPSASDG